jgi:glycosyltransferase involved in cell wall biosynthesis
VVGLGSPNSSSLSNRVRSGGETKLLQMIKNWISAGHQVDYFTTEAYAKALKIEGINCNCITLPSQCNQSMLGEAYIFLKRLFFSFFIRVNGGYDFVYCSSDLFFDVIPSLLLSIRLKRVKLIYCSYLISTSMTLKSIRGGFFFFAQKISYLLIRLKNDLVLVLNDVDRERLEKKRISPKNIYVTSGGVDHEELNRIKVTPEVNFDAVFLGRFHHQKGLDLLIRAWEMVVRKFPQFTLAVVGGGDGAVINELEEKIAKLNLDQSVKIFKNLNRDKALSIVKSSDIFLFPSRDESWGFVVAEALYFGKPVVMFDLSYSREIFTKGIVRVKKFDVDEFGNQFMHIKNDRIFYEMLAINHSRLRATHSCR